MHDLDDEGGDDGHPKASNLLGGMSVLLNRHQECQYIDHYRLASGTTIEHCRHILNLVIPLASRIALLDRHVMQVPIAH